MKEPAKIVWMFQSMDHEVIVLPPFLDSVMDVQSEVSGTYKLIEDPEIPGIKVELHHNDGIPLGIITLSDYITLEEIQFKKVLQKDIVEVGRRSNKKFTIFLYNEKRGVKYVFELKHKVSKTDLTAI